MWRQRWGALTLALIRVRKYSQYSRVQSSTLVNFRVSVLHHWPVSLLSMHRSWLFGPAGRCHFLILAMQGPRLLVYRLYLPHENNVMYYTSTYCTVLKLTLVFFSFLFFSCPSPFLLLSLPFLPFLYRYFPNFPFSYFHILTSPFSIPAETDFYCSTHSLIQSNPEGRTWIQRPRYSS